MFIDKRFLCCCCCFLTMVLASRQPSQSSPKNSSLELHIFPTYAHQTSTQEYSIDWQWTVQSVLIYNRRDWSPIFSKLPFIGRGIRQIFGKNYQRDRLRYFRLKSAANSPILFYMPDCLVSPIDLTPVDDIYSVSEDEGTNRRLRPYESIDCRVRRLTGPQSLMKWNISVRLDTRQYPPGSNYTFYATTADGQRWQAAVTLMADGNGLSFVYDMDETLKPFGRDLKTTAYSLFSRPYYAFQGIPRLVRQWYSDAASPLSTTADFVYPTVHLVSGAMWQLIPSFIEFFRNYSLPLDDVAVNEMDMHSLKSFLGDLRRFMKMKDVKLAYIRQLIIQFPRRKFILMGDTAIGDHWVYAQLLQEFPASRVPLALLHRVQAASWRLFSAKRKPEDLYQGISRDRWIFFDRVSELNDLDMREYL